MSVLVCVVGVCVRACVLNTGVSMNVRDYVFMCTFVYVRVCEIDCASVCVRKLMHNSPNPHPT